MSHSATRHPPSRRGRSPVALALRAGLTAFLLAAAASAQVTLYEHVDFRGRSETFYGAELNLKRSFIGNDRASSVVVERGCTAVLYADSEFRGRAIEVRGAIENLRHTAVGNDRVSSIDVFCGRRSGVGRHDGYRSQKRYRSHRTYPDRNRPDAYRSRRSRTYDDRYPAYRERPRSYRSRSRSVGLHKDDRFSGRTIWVSGPIPNLRHTHLGNDELTSVTVPPGCRVTLFTDSEYRGRALVLYEDVPNLRYTHVGNDRVSSVDVDCR